MEEELKEILFTILEEDKKEIKAINSKLEQIDNQITNNLILEIQCAIIEAKHDLQEKKESIFLKYFYRKEIIRFLED